MYSIKIPARFPQSVWCIVTVVPRLVSFTVVVTNTIHSVVASGKPN